MSRASCHFWRTQAGVWSDADANAFEEAFAELQGSIDGQASGEYLIWWSQLLYMRSEYRESRRCATDGLRKLAQGVDGTPLVTLPQMYCVWALVIDALFLGEWGEALREIATS
jgi:hypothetical protein